MNEQMYAVPFEPTDEQWSGLARHIMMWLDFNDKTGKALHSHLNMLGIEIPEWLAKEIPNVNHVPSKGNRVTAIYKAMLLDYKPAKVENTPT